MMMHTLKTKLSKYQNFIDKAFEHIAQGSDEQIVEVSITFLKSKDQYWAIGLKSKDQYLSQLEPMCIVSYTL